MYMNQNVPAVYLDGLGKFKFKKPGKIFKKAFKSKTKVLKKGLKLGTTVLKKGAQLQKKIIMAPIAMSPLFNKRRKKRGDEQVEEQASETVYEPETVESPTTVEPIFQTGMPAAYAPDDYGPEEPYPADEMAPSQPPVSARAPFPYEMEEDVETPGEGYDMSPTSYYPDEAGDTDTAEYYESEMGYLGLEAQAEVAATAQPWYTQLIAVYGQVKAAREAEKFRRENLERMRKGVTPLSVSDWSALTPPAARVEVGLPPQMMNMLLLAGLGMAAFMLLRPRGR